MKTLPLSALLCLALPFLPPARAQDHPGAGLPAGRTIELSRAELQDRIRGGWAGQAIGVTYGGPTEFRFNGTFIQDYVPIVWDETRLKWWYDNAPGLYDDIYMDLTFVDVFEREGLDAPAASFANAFANAGYMLWHANQQARYNILNGLAPPESGHWRNNPEADDIDFQIEADFAGLMSPGLPNAASGFCDTVGHIMNSGDGYYGGVYVAALYALAFTSGDVEYVVEEALRTIPRESTFHKTIRDVIHWHRTYPDDWKETWFQIQRKWAEDIGCIDGVYRPFDIDAKMNAAYVVLGLLYGGGDFTRTVEITTRAGQDSDCNPATAAGVLGAMIGYSNIPAYWKQGLAAVEPVDFKYTTISLEEAYDLSFRHALEVIRRHGGQVEGDRIVIPVQEPRPVPLEQNFTGHRPAGEIPLGTRVVDEVSFAFEGIGFAVGGYAESTDGTDRVLEAEVYLDGQLVETTRLPTSYTTRKYVPFWRYDLPNGPHTVRIQIKNPSESTPLHLDRVIVYGPVR